MSIFREGQEMPINPWFLYENTSASSMMDFVVHAAIVSAELVSFLGVLKRVRSRKIQAECV